TLKGKQKVIIDLMVLNAVSTLKPAELPELLDGFFDAGGAILYAKGEMSCIIRNQLIHPVFPNERRNSFRLCADGLGNRHGNAHDTPCRLSAEKDDVRIIVRPTFRRNHLLTMLLFPDIQGLSEPNTGR